ncbi:MAG: hypothetical protein WCV73_03580 [Patescibacteria group bacterium]|jgi:hypothetical protein
MSKNDGQEESYAVANALAYGGEILPRPMRSDEASLSQLGTQPLGTCSWGENNFAFVGYFEPCIYIGKLSSDGSLIELEAIRWVRYGDQLHRIFPPNAQPGEANRGQTVSPGPEGTLIVSCNASRTFYVLQEPEDLGDYWRCVRQFDLPNYPIPGFRHVHAALFTVGNLLVMTSAGDLNQPWEIGEYAHQNGASLVYEAHVQRE